MSRTNETEIAYLRRSARIIDTLAARYGRRLRLPEDTGVIVSLALTDLKPVLRPSSWRQYRAALAYSIAQHPDYGAAPEISMLAAAALLEPGCRCRWEPPRTSARKRRRLLLSDLARLQAYADAESSPDSTGAFVVKWLLFGSLLGLRPCEWRGAAIEHDESRCVLVVANAKATNGRGLPEPRILGLDEFPHQMVADIHAFIGILQDEVNQGGYARLHARCAKWLYRACRHAWPRRKRHVALYTARHEAAARWKLVYDAREVAALLGHAVDYTATRHYARRRVGSRRQKVDRLLPRPTERAVSLVRVTNRASFAQRRLRRRSPDASTDAMTLSPDL